MEGQWLTFSPITTEDLNVVWVKNYDEFEKWIYCNGLPDAICFDHDLADEHYHDSMYISKESYDNYLTECKEKTGMDCAKFVVDYCMEYKLKLPLYNIQSANPVGKENIDSYLKQFKASQN